MRICAALCFLLISLVAIEARAQVIAIEHRAQLLLDDRIVEKSEGLVRTVHQPQPHEANPLLSAEKPWEFTTLTLWGSVIYDEQDQIFKMWYQTWGNVPPPGVSTLICYATSKDGLKWDRPDLGLIDFKGDKHTNIIVAPQAAWLDSPTVVKDLADADPSRRYKMSFCESGPDVAPAIFHGTSPDGIHWNRMDGPVVHAGDRNSMYFDTGRKKWVVITRMPGIEARTVAMADGSEFGKYDPMHLIFQKDDQDPADSDLYSMPTFMYEGMRIGCVEVYEHPTGREITQLAWSHDGVTWMRDPQRQPFMLWGEKPAFDWARRTPQNGPPIVRDGKLWMYFGGRSTLKRSPDPRRVVGAIGVATLRIDGFCSRDAGDQEATLLTKPLQVAGGELVINADIKPNGSLRVQVDGTDQSQDFQGDKIDHKMALRDAGGKPIKLKFTLRHADLYSFKIH